MPKRSYNSDKHTDSKTTTEDASLEDSKRSSSLITYVILIVVACLVAGGEFLDQRRPEQLFPASELTKVKHLSDYHRSLRKTRGDTELFIFEGREPGGTALIVGGTHPNEPASMVTATLLTENIRVDQGRVIIIVRANSSGFTATEPQEGYPSEFYITSRSDRKRRFRVGSRFTNILDGWPDPTVYKHHPSGQMLSGNETRNLNRAYPGKADGSLTEMVAYAITEVVRKEKVDMFIDLHEAAPEYPVINAMVAHEKAMDVASIAVMDLQMSGLEFGLEPSPANFHGLSHREIGDATDARAVLMESAGALQGRLRGKTDTDLIINSVDPLYSRAGELNRLYVSFPEEGVPLEVRVGRHLEGIKKVFTAMVEIMPEKAIRISRVPGFEELQEHNVGYYLK